MSGVVAAVVGGAAVLGAAATVYGANKAASATTNASNAAINAQNTALAQQQKNAAPYMALGTSNIPTYQALLTGGGGPNAGANIQNTLANTPGYQATLQTGTEAAMRAAGASGENLTGNQIQGVETYGAQLADQTYQQQLQNLLQPVQIGQAAAAGQSANIGQAATNVGNIAIGQGNTQAGITANEIAGITRAAGNAGNQAITYQTLAGLNNPGYNASYTPQTGLTGPTYNADLTAGIGTPGYVPPVGP